MSHKNWNWRQAEQEEGSNSLDYELLVQELDLVIAGGEPDLEKLEKLRVALMEEEERKYDKRPGHDRLSDEQRQVLWEKSALALAAVQRKETEEQTGE